MGTNAATGIQECTGVLERSDLSIPDDRRSCGGADMRSSEEI